MTGLPALLEGLITEYPSRYPGLAKLVGMADSGADDQGAGALLVEELKQRPGFTRIDYLKGRSASDNGWYIPYGLLRAGQKPGPLEAWQPEPYDVAPSGLKLDGHQLRSVSFLRAVASGDGGAILGADIGTGKTNCALHAMWLDGFLHGGGVVTGSLGAKDTWCSEGGDPLRHYGLTITPLTGTEADTSQVVPGRWYFVHFDVIEYWLGTLINAKPRALIVDESHNLCNPKSRRHKAVKSLSSMASIERRVLLTGTPIPKGRMDLEGELEIAQPNQWDWVRFGVFHCGGHRELHAEDDAHWVFDGRSNTEELRARLAGVYLRYTKERAAEMGTLPKLIRQRIDIELDESVKSDYHLALTDITKYRELRQQGVALPDKITIAGTTYVIPKEKPVAAGLVITSTLKSILDRGKLPHTARVIEQLLPSHEKILVGTWRRESARSLVKELRRGGLVEVFGPITGEDAFEKRIQIAAAFAEYEDQAIIVTTRGALKESINRLAVCDAVLQVTPDWNPDSNLQFEGRVHRKGNPHSEVYSYYMLVPKTLDDRVLELIRLKGEEAKHLSENDTAGWNLAVELDPTGFEGEQWSIDEICAMASEIQEM